MTKTYFYVIFLLSSFSAHCALDAFSHSDAPINIDAEKEIVCDEKTGRCDAYGNAVATRENLKIYADQLTATFDGESKKITGLTASGHVIIKTPQESAFGDHADYNAHTDVLHLTGSDIRLYSPKYVITAKNFLEYDNSQEKATLQGDALIYIREKDQYISADRITGYFSKKDSKEASKERLRTASAQGHVFIGTPDSMLSGNEGLYDALAQRADITGDVVLIKGPNIIKGDQGWVNLETNHAEMSGGFSEKNVAPSRTRGLITPKNVKKNQNNLFSIKE